MKWASDGLRYLRDARAAIQDEFNDLMNEVKEYGVARGVPWYSTCKNINPTAYHYSMEFYGDQKIPGDKFSSPLNFGIIDS